MKEIGGAREGQRTMVDAMQPAFEVLSEDGNLETAAQKAREGANKTKDSSTFKTLSV
jgi:dihydroxyacetone kinase